MRKITVFALLMVFTLSEAQNLSKEELAIKSVIEKETELFYKGDFESWALQWDHSSPIYFGVYSCEFKMEFTDWESLSKSAKENMQANVDVNLPLPEKTDYKFFVNKSSALVIFKEDGDLSSRVLIKGKDGWKISNYSGSIFKQA